MKRIHCGLIALIVLTSGAAGAAPKVKLSQNTDHPQANDKVSGSGFDPYRAIDIYWDTTDILLATTNGNGVFAPVKFTVPSDALPGEHWISAVERYSGTAAQALFTVNTDWAQRGFDVGGTRYNPWENVISPDNVDKLDVAWTYTTKNTVSSSAAVANGTVYIGSNDANLYALDAVTGSLKWSLALDGPIDLSSPAVANGTVYIGTTGGTLYAIDAAAGVPKWGHSTGYVIESSPTVSNGMVYFGANDGYLYALDATTGNTVWVVPTVVNAAIDGAPAIGKGYGGNNIVYIGSGDDVCCSKPRIYAFDALTGTQLWYYPTSRAVLASPAVSNGKVYIGSFDHYLYTIDARSGSLRCDTDFGAELYASPAVARGIVYVAGLDGRLTAASFYPPGIPSCMPAYWQFNNYYSIGSPAVADGVVYFGSSSGSVAALSAGKEGGSYLWSSSTGGVVSSPAVANGMLYVGSSDRNVYAYALNGGKNAVYKRKHTPPPRFSELQPNFNLHVSR